MKEVFGVQDVLHIKKNKKKCHTSKFSSKKLSTSLKLFENAFLL